MSKSFFKLREQAESNKKYLPVIPGLNIPHIFINRDFFATIQIQSVTHITYIMDNMDAEIKCEKL